MTTKQWNTACNVFDVVAKIGRNVVVVSREGAKITIHAETLKIAMCALSVAIESTETQKFHVHVVRLMNMSVEIEVTF